ncbi:hypothetical protein IE53DRAFT_412397 [Violaceomyces palustris]|uniref:Uncharacterized protein n=1 Tax=Violaceomyces palustris TaxID=1673888 RepID=A0ACD0NRD3_9BASI|nr:hypothetical protein IE53DRAFT_412397 [Violaceomyces palustris]
MDDPYHHQHHQPQSHQAHSGSFAYYQSQSLSQGPPSQEPYPHYSNQQHQEAQAGPTSSASGYLSASPYFDAPPTPSHHLGSPPNSQQNGGNLPLTSPAGESFRPARKRSSTTSSSSSFGKGVGGSAAAAAAATATTGQSHHHQGSYPTGGRIHDSIVPPATARNAIGVGSNAQAQQQRKQQQQKGMGSGEKSSMHKSSLRTNGSDPYAWFRVPSKMASAFMLTILIEAVVVTTMVAIAFGIIQTRIYSEVQDLKTVPVYLSIFVFGMIFEVVVGFDAVRLKNTIQVIGVSIFNVALTITAALEITQVRDSLRAQDELAGGIPCRDDPSMLCATQDTIYPTVQKFLIVVPIVCGVAQVPIVYFTFKLWSEFGWDVYKRIGADLRIRNMFVYYQTFIVLIKFTFFFGVGFTMAYLILVASTTEWTFGVTVAAVPIAIAALLAAGFAVRREITSLMSLALFLMLAGVVYFIYKLVTVWSPSTRQDYAYVKLTLTFFSAFAILSLLLTLTNGIVCLLNFNKGLKQAHDSIGKFGGVRRKRVGERASVGHQNELGGAVAGGILEDEEEEEEFPNHPSSGMVDSNGGGGRFGAGRHEEKEGMSIREKEKGGIRTTRSEVRDLEG